MDRASPNSSNKVKSPNSHSDKEVSRNSPKRADKANRNNPRVASHKARSRVTTSSPGKMRKHNQRPLAVTGAMLTAVLLLIAGCLPADKQFHSYRSIPSCGWVWGDTIHFITTLSDSLVHYRYTVEVRHDNSYPYSQLAVAFNVNSADDSTIYSDTLHSQLSNEQGVWLGQGWGNLFVSTHPGHTFTIPHSGSYTLCLNHIMRRDTLPGIFNVGIRIETVPASEGDSKWMPATQAGDRKRQE